MQKPLRTALALAILANSVVILVALRIWIGG